MNSLLDFQKYIYSKRSHFDAFIKYSSELYGEESNLYLSALKKYQDLLVMMFIKKFVPTGSRILDVGGGNSRILNTLHNSYECWNIDPLQGVGQGPSVLEKIPYKLVLDYMGNFNTELADHYFDFVFSISALEHSPKEKEKVDLIIEDIQRVLKPEGLSLHLLDAVIRDDQISIHPFITESYALHGTIGALPDVNDIIRDPDLFYMTKNAYDFYWKKCTNMEYMKFGKPISVNVLWRA